MTEHVGLTRSMLSRIVEAPRCALGKCWVGYPLVSYFLVSNSLVRNSLVSYTLVSDHLSPVVQCFLQGWFLNTPELVPFRLTRDIVDGMGIGGTEGVMRRCCEECMRVLRDNRESMLTVCTGDQDSGAVATCSWAAGAGVQQQGSSIRGPGNKASGAVAAVSWAAAAG